MTTSPLTPTPRTDLIPADLLTVFGTFLRLHVADGDASPHTLRSYHSNVGQFVNWCGDLGTVYQAADLSGPVGQPDCYVDLYDLQVILEGWLTCTDPDNPDQCD